MLAMSGESPFHGGLSHYEMWDKVLTQITHKFEKGVLICEPSLDSRIVCGVAGIVLAGRTIVLDLGVSTA